MSNDKSLERLLSHSAEVLQSLNREGQATNGRVEAVAAAIREGMEEVAPLTAGGLKDDIKGACEAVVAICQLVKALGDAYEVLDEDVVKLRIRTPVEVVL